MGQMLEAIADPDNLGAAWARVRANAGAAGGRDRPPSVVPLAATREMRRRAA
jgi:hypothetical protein